MDITRRRHKIASILVVVGLSLTPFFSAQAALLTVEPTVTRMTVLPGWEWLGSVRITNSGLEEVRVQIESINLISGIEPGDAPVPVFGESTVDREVSLAGWMKLPIKQVRIAPQDSVQIPVAIIVPAYAGHGIHRAAVAFRQEGVRPTEGGAKVSATIVSGFLVDVIGDEHSRHDVRLASFGIDRFFSSHFPVRVNVRIENRGTTLGILDGEVIIDSVLGFGGVRFPVATVHESRYLRPGSAYENTYELTDSAIGSRAGLYRATIVVTNGGAVLEDSALFVVVPVPVGLALLAVLLIAVGGVKFAIRRGRKRS